MTASGLDDAAAKLTRAAAAMPQRDRGRHTSAQNAANSRYQVVFTALLAISSIAVGSSTTLAASSTRSSVRWTWPELAWKTNTPRHDAVKAPASAKPMAASDSGNLTITSAANRG